MPTIDQLPKTSAEAIVEFDARFLTSLAAAPAPSWRNVVAQTMDVGSPDVRFPISLIGAKYHKFEGSNRFRSLEEKMVALAVDEFDAGYEAKVIDLVTNVFAYQRWSEAPGRLVQASEATVTRLVLDLLKNGASTPCFDGVNFFSQTHPANPFVEGGSTWSNYQPVAKSVTSLVDLTGEITAMQGVLDENGDELGLDPDTLFVGTARHQPAVNMLSQQQLISDGVGGNAATVTNPYQNKFNVVHVPNWTGNDWMLFDSKLAAAQGLDPFVAARWIPGEELSNRWFDQSSDFFKQTGKIAFSSHIWLGAALLFPHCLRLVKGS